MPDQVERKFIDLKALKVSDEGSGFIEGYRSVFGEIDEGGDIIVPGAFKDCIAEYLRSGFTAESHDWDFSKAVGYPVEAKEDERGWFVRSQFHSTSDAQNVRTKAQERFAAGLQVGFSFGYKVDDFQVVEQEDFKEQLPQFVKTDRLEENLTKAKKFNSIRILKRVSAIEDSLVTAPMNKLAMATAMKADLDKQIKNLLAEHGDEKIIERINQELSDPDKYLKGITVSDSLESFDDVVSALEKQTHNMQRNHENRVKEGRILSTANRAKVQAAYDALGALLAESEPKPKEKQIDMAALRTQSERMLNRVLALTA